MKEKKIEAIANMLANHGKVYQWYETPFRFSDAVKMMDSLRTLQESDYDFPLHVALAASFFENVDCVPFYHVDVRAYMHGVRNDTVTMWSIIDNVTTNLKGIAELVDMVYNGGNDEMEKFLRERNEESLRELLNKYAGERYCEQFMKCL